MLALHPHPQAVGRAAWINDRIGDYYSLGLEGLLVQVLNSFIVLSHIPSLIPSDKGAVQLEPPIRDSLIRLLKILLVLIRQLLSAHL